MCKYALINKCDRGENCTFAHDISELRIKPDMRKTKLCKSYILGKCTDHNCIYAHSVNELREVGKPAICQLHREGRCIKGNQCRFAHSINDINTKLVQFYEENMDEDEMEFSHLNSCMDSVSPGESSTLNRGGGFRSGEMLHVARQEKRGEWKVSINFSDGTSNSSSGSNQHTRESTRTTNRRTNTSKGMNRANLVKNSSCSSFMNNNLSNLSCRKGEKKNEDILNGRNGKYTKLCAINMNMKTIQGGVCPYDKQLVSSDDKQDYLLEGKFKRMNSYHNRQEHDGNASTESMRQNFTPPINMRSIMCSNVEGAMENGNTNGLVDYRIPTNGEVSVNCCLPRNEEGMSEGSTVGLRNKQGGKSIRGANFPHGEGIIGVRASGKKVMCIESSKLKEEKNKMQGDADRGNGLIHNSEGFRVGEGQWLGGEAYGMEMLFGNCDVGRRRNGNGRRGKVDGGDCGVGTYPTELHQRRMNNDPSGNIPYDRKIPYCGVEANLSNEMNKGNEKNKHEVKSHVERYYESALDISRDERCAFMEGSVVRFEQTSEYVSNLMGNQNRTLGVRDTFPSSVRGEFSDEATVMRRGNEEGDNGDGQKVREAKNDTSMCSFAKDLSGRMPACAVDPYVQGNRRVQHKLAVKTERRSIGTGGHSLKGLDTCLCKLENGNSNSSNDQNCENHSDENPNGASKQGSAEGLTRYGSGMQGESNSQYGSSSTVDMCAQNVDEVFFGKAEESGIGSTCRQSAGVIDSSMERASLGSYEGKAHDGAHEKEMLKYFHDVQKWRGCSMLDRLETEDGKLERGVSDERGGRCMDSPNGLGDYTSVKNYSNFMPYKLFSLFKQNRPHLKRLPNNCGVKSASHRCVSQDEVLLDRTEKRSISIDLAERKDLANAVSVTKQKGVLDSGESVEGVCGGQERGGGPLYSGGKNGRNNSRNSSLYRMNLRVDSVREKNSGKSGRNEVRSGNLTEEGGVEAGGPCGRSGDGGNLHVGGLNTVIQEQVFCSGERGVDAAKYDLSGGSIDERRGEKHTVSSFTAMEHRSNLREEGKVGMTTGRGKNNKTLHRQEGTNSPVVNKYLGGRHDYVILSEEDKLIQNEQHMLYRWLGLSSSLSESCPMGMESSGDSPLLPLDDEESYLINLDTTGGIENALWNEKDMGCWSKRIIPRRSMVYNGAESGLKNKEEELYRSNLDDISNGYEEIGSNNIFMGNYKWDDKEERLVSTDEGSVQVGKNMKAKKGERHFQKSDFYGDLTERNIFSRHHPCEGGGANMIDDLSWGNPKWDDEKWDHVRLNMDDVSAGGCSNDLVGTRSKGEMSFLGNHADKENRSDRGRSHANHVGDVDHALTTAFLNYGFENGIEDDIVRSFLEESSSLAYDRLDSSFFYDFHVGGNGRPYLNHQGDGEDSGDCVLSGKEKNSAYDDVNGAAFEDGSFCVDLSKDMDLQFFSQGG
ncbi:zinc finger protein, putative [Plasmodium knowlesi strain H]|nr:putative Zinc finger protein [Plasmodium knowlesi]SBO23814.1 zinc finger protein, putative [Plasmodium knowlesi strain H]SBO25577.1 zinc finger protein, putative [Plasmodium knowlesi strain H]|eukprot:XP_002261707.1 hypothetical protein, conserved in Plasmodium species [Plasmodium knowlesi strain H]